MMAHRPIGVGIVGAEKSIDEFNHITGVAETIQTIPKVGV